MRTLVELIKENLDNRCQMWELAKSHQKKKFHGSDMGMLWAFAKPTMYIVVFYGAISIGFKGSKNIDGIICPYFVWLTVGMIAFFYVRDMIINGANCFKKYAPFIAKAKYPVATLPTTVAMAYLLIHLGMLALGVVVCLIFGVLPSMYWLQLPFYMALMVIMVVFWSIGSGILSVIYRDFYNFLQVVNQAVFWLSAILFDVNGLGPHGQMVFMFNPITYIVEGYRNCFCRHVWFWEEPMKLVCFMLVLVIMMSVAIVLYKKVAKMLPDLVE